MKAEIKIPGRYFWNLRSAVNVRLLAHDRDVHRPEFVYCTDKDRKQFCVEDVDLSREKK